MIDETLQELWAIKDGLAQENAYDLEKLACFLANKYQSKSLNKSLIVEDTEQMPRPQRDSLRPRSAASFD
jgi:hypothetical protein